MFKPGSFDVVSFIQVVEHVPDPVGVLRSACSHLRPGGLVCIEVPSRYAPHFLLYQATRLRRLIEPPRGVIPQHVGYHHPASIRLAAKRAGFKEVSLTTGRWGVKYCGWKRLVGLAVDPLLNAASIGGILYLGAVTDLLGPA
jgi:SAM-dependent methyltransferase